MKPNPVKHTLRTRMTIAKVTNLFEMNSNWIFISKIIDSFLEKRHKINFYCLWNHLDIKSFERFFLPPQKSDSKHQNKNVIGENGKVLLAGFRSCVLLIWLVLQLCRLLRITTYTTQYRIGTILYNTDLFAQSFLIFLRLMEKY